MWLSARLRSAWESVGIAVKILHLFNGSGNIKIWGNALSPLVHIRTLCPFVMFNYFIYEVFTMTTKSKSAVVAQIVEAPKAEYVLTTEEFGSVGSLLDLVIKAENALFEGDLGMEKAGMALAKLMGTNPT